MSKLIIIIFCLILSLGGCAAQLYLFNDKTYSLSHEALVAQQEYNRKIVEQISPTKNPINGSTLLIVPSRSLILKFGIVARSLNLTSEGLEYLLTSAEMVYELMSDVLIKHKIFTDVSVIKADEPDTVSLSGNDILIDLSWTGPNKFQWYLKTNSHTEGVPIFVEGTLEKGLPAC